MSALITNAIQVGRDPTPNRNVTIYQPDNPDGTVRVGVGNEGATTEDILVASAAEVLMNNPKAKANPEAQDDSKLLATTEWVRNLVFAGNTNNNKIFLPDGKIIQYGKVSINTSTSDSGINADIIFPTAFPNACFIVIGVAGITTNNLNVANYRNLESIINIGVPTLTGVQVHIKKQTSVADSSNRYFQWQAIGN